MPMRKRDCGPSPEILGPAQLRRRRPHEMSQDQGMGDAKLTQGVVDQSGLRLQSTADSGEITIRVRQTVIVASSARPNPSTGRLFHPGSDGRYRPFFELEKNEYRISMAIAGFGPDEVELTSAAPRRSSWARRRRGRRAAGAPPGQPLTGIQRWRKSGLV